MSQAAVVIIGKDSRGERWLTRKQPLRDQREFDLVSLWSNRLLLCARRLQCKGSTRSKASAAPNFNRSIFLWEGRGMFFIRHCALGACSKSLAASQLPQHDVTCFICKGSRHVINYTRASELQKLSFQLHTAYLAVCTQLSSISDSS